MRNALLVDRVTPIDALLGRQREAARLFALGHTNIEVANALGYHKAYMPQLKQQPKMAAHIDSLQDKRDDVVRDITSRVKVGASSGLDYLVRILTPGTPECVSTPIVNKIRVAQDFLDREGSAPKVTKQKSTGEVTHLHVTPDDIAHLHALRDARRAQQREQQLHKVIEVST